MKNGKTRTENGSYEIRGEESDGNVKIFEESDQFVSQNMDEQ